MKIKWGSFYTVVQNLEKYGLIEAVGSDRDGRRPERTTYAITDDGRAELRTGCASCRRTGDGVSALRGGAVGARVLPPDEVTALLTTRVATLETEIAAQRTALAGEDVPASS
jgi:hypothetical protein